MLNPYQKTLETFSTQGVKPPVWQPRIYYWYNWNLQHGTLPDKYKEMSMADIYREIGASIRYFPEVFKVSALERELSPRIAFRSETTGDLTTEYLETPSGVLTHTKTVVLGEGWRTLKYPIETMEDIKIAINWFSGVQWHLKSDNITMAETLMGTMGFPQFYLPRSGYQSLVIEWMGLENLVTALHEDAIPVEELMSAIDHSYDQLYEEILQNDRIKILNFGENIDVNISPPRYFEKYCIPFYTKRIHQLQPAGIYTHIHIDGRCKPLLKYLHDLPFSGYEALTPFPQGDVSLEDIKTAIGDKILLDGIPAICFLPDYPYKDLMTMAQHIIDMFSPHLILGISDELPPLGEIERVRDIQTMLEQP